MKQVSILGGGAFGTSFATLLANNGYNVKLWCYEPETAQAIEKDRCNEKFLPGIKLDERIVTVTDLQEALSGATWVFEATPVKFLRSVLQKSSPFFSEDQNWVLLSKGIENETLLLPGQILDDVFKTTVKKAVVGGPSFAMDIAKKQITGVTVASEDENIGRKLQTMLACDYFRPYFSRDFTGVQIGGALKNVLTLGIGMLEGAGFTDNTKAFLFTCGLREMATCARELGANQQTLYGFSGVGDLVLTSMGGLSRNLLVGKRLGEGQSIDQILQETGLIPEGINTVRSVHQLCENHKLDLPVFDGLYSVIFENKTVHDFLRDLMARPLEDE